MGSFDHLFKVLVVGDSSVGKTSLLNRYVNDVFGKEYKMTMGVDFALKVMQWSDTEVVRLQLWDIAATGVVLLFDGLSFDKPSCGSGMVTILDNCNVATPGAMKILTATGQERFTSMTRLYYKQASACVIMFDLTNSESFRSCQMWKNDLDSKVTLPNGDFIPCILLANKCDLLPWAVSKEQIDKFSKENNFIGWTETSVKENKNVNESMRVLIERMMETREYGRSSFPPQGDYINLKDISVPGSGCC